MIDPREFSWAKSSYSGGNGDCVELGRNEGPVVAVRDTKDEGQGLILAVGRREWMNFLAGVKAGEFGQQ